MVLACKYLSILGIYCGTLILRHPRHGLFLSERQRRVQNIAVLQYLKELINLL